MIDVDELVCVNRFRSKKTKSITFCSISYGLAKITKLHLTTSEVIKQPVGL